MVLLSPGLPGRFGKLARVGRPHYIVGFTRSEATYMRTDSALPVRLADYRVPDYLVDHVNLDIRLGRHETEVRSRLAMRPNPLGRPGAPLVLDGDELRATGVAIDATELDLRAGFATATRLVIEVPPQRAFTLEVTTLVNPLANTKLMGLFRSGSAYCTQCEAEGFRRITYFPDRPDVLSRYSVRIEADKAEAPILLGNGNLVASGDIAGTGRHFAIWDDPHPKPSYLFALVGGDLGSIHDTFVTASGRKVALGIYVEHGKESRARYAMDALKRSMLWDERAYGREYDLDVFNIVAVSDFNMGAMENKGLNIFNDKLVLASPETATDEDYGRIEAVIAHEYFHNWTGNRITCRDWFQLCLKEGLTVFRDQEFTSDERSRPVKRIADVRGLRANQFPEDGGPLAHNVRPESYHEINNFYTATVYEKGAELIRMLRALIGDAAFRAGMDLYFARCDGMAATMEDFLACFAQTSGRDLAHFQRWYAQAGTPVLTVAARHDAAAQTLTLDLGQSCAPTPGQPLKEALLMPIALGLVGEDGRDLPLAAASGATAGELARGIFELGTASRRIVFGGIAHKPVVSILRGFSAPVRLESDIDGAGLLTLAAHDSDPFNRWQSAQTLAMRLMVGAALRRKALVGDPAPFVAALALVLERGAEDPAFAAQMLALPGESDIAREIGANVDPDAIHVARDALRRTIGLELQAKLAATYMGFADKGAYSPDAASAGRRALRAAVLGLLCAGAPETGEAFAKVQFAGAKNMTEELAALDMLARGAPAGRQPALDAFYARHTDDALVVDKWFSVQAMIPEPETLENVRALVRHRAFSMGNPNRIRALIGAFAGSNPSSFHAADGSGYAFLAATVIALDATNPQVAARMLGSMRSWHALEPGRQAKARIELERVAAVPSLSPDVRDIVTRSLA